jgi:hypothetical protein
MIADPASLESDEARNGLVIAYIIVYYDNGSIISSYGASDVVENLKKSKFRARMLVELLDVNVIKQALSCKYCRKELSKHYGIESTVSKSSDDLITNKMMGTSSGFTLSFPYLGRSAVNTDREFPTVHKSISSKYDDTFRVSSIQKNVLNSAASVVSQSILDKRTFSEAAILENNQKISSVDEEEYKYYTIDEQVIHSLKVLSQNKKKTNEKIMKKMFTDDLFDIKTIITDLVRQSVASEIDTLSDSLKTLGLDRTLTYVEGNYEQPAGDLAVRTNRIKGKCPILFDLILNTICAVNIKEEKYGVLGLTREISEAWQ